ncbi:hypothetical protein GCM10022380_74580 [Amycolatopsis tucumanensis]|uniref:Uncharacterized protein n=1 Tax=Amycolatopsis tucumanensis TaxID=401106 RepID=A0ABP7JI19_9PSEU
MRAFFARCREYGIDVQEARRALARARTDVRAGRVLEVDPYKLAWRRLRRRHT